MALYCLSDPCEYNNLAHSNLDIVERLLRKLIEFQKKALPVWFPERDPMANPARRSGYWGPWMSSKSNKFILQGVLDNVPNISKKKHYEFSSNATNEGNLGKVISTHAIHDKQVVKMLRKILKMTHSGKKGNIPQINSALMKESMSMLYAKMKEKTKVDDLMHKLQMIKKGQVAKEKDHRSRKYSSKNEVQSLHLSDPKMLHKKRHRTDKNGAKRANIEKFKNEDVEDALNLDSSLENKAEQINLASSSSNSGDVEQSHFKSGESLNEDDMYVNNPTDGESDSENSTSGQSADFTGETSTIGPGNEFQEADDVIDGSNGENEENNVEDL